MRATKSRKQFVKLAFALALGMLGASRVLAAVSNDPVIEQRGIISFRFGITGIKGTFSTSAHRYSVTGLYAITEDRNRTGENNPNKVSVSESYEWVASGQFTLADGATAETLEFYSPSNRSFAGSLISNMVCKKGDPWREAKGPCERVISTPNWQTAINFRNDLSTTAAGVPFSSVLTWNERARLNQQYQIYLASRQPLKRQLGGSTQCNPGFVPRMAGPTDYVCVTPESSQRVQQENATAASRRNPKGGAYGPNTCLTGFVWRGAFAGDVVCVTPEVRQVTRQENELSSSRSSGPGHLMRR